MAYYPPPANVQDFSEELKEEWSNYMDELFDQTISYDPSDFPNYGPRPAFLNPHKEGVSPNRSYDVKIEWNAFPKTLTSDFGYTGFDEKYSHGDMRQRTSRDTQGRVIGIYQDEYLEWSYRADEDGDIAEIFLTCENPEYWGFFLHKDQSKALEVYSELCGGIQIDIDELFPDGNQYDPQNVYNLEHCIHLCQPNNTLGAELDIAACATIVREKNGEIITDQEQLVNCGKFGNPGRNSDPHIGISVNDLVRPGQTKISIPNPVGLYMEYKPNDTIIMPDDTDPAELFTVVRSGEWNGDQYIVRGRIAPPQGKDWKLKDIILGNANFKYAGQFVDYMFIYLHGFAEKSPGYTPVPTPCSGVKSTPKPQLENFLNARSLQLPLIQMSAPLRWY